MGSAVDWPETLPFSPHKRKKPSRFREGFCVLPKEQIFHRVEEISVFGRPGSDLLFQALRLSTIGAGEFNGRVRDGIGFRPPASTTRSAKNGNRARTQESKIRRFRALDVSDREASWNFTRATPRRARAQHSIIQFSVED